MNTSLHFMKVLNHVTASYRESGIQLVGFFDPKKVHVKRATMKPFLYEVDIDGVTVNVERITIHYSMSVRVSYGHKKTPLFLINMDLKAFMGIEGDTDHDLRIGTQTE